MGLGAYLAAATEREHYMAEEKRERDEIGMKPEAEKEVIYEIMTSYGIRREDVTPLVSALELNVEEWVRVCPGLRFTWSKVDIVIVYDELRTPVRKA